MQELERLIGLDTFITKAVIRAGNKRATAEALAGVEEEREVPETQEPQVDNPFNNSSLSSALLSILLSINTSFSSTSLLSSPTPILTSSAD